ncbi:MAG: YraN family protein [Thermosynechococcaceae cyanobacterium MS004]|nr:YraN family protein [Thermosynechococcaceae cyanobacterium MS004]
MPIPEESAQRKPNTSLIGKYGERLVAQWLQQQGWTILAQGWSCRWGELDVVAHWTGDRPSSSETPETGTLAFVEVKTRSSGNWDTNGLFAITPAKQAKLRKTAQLFLSTFPQFADSPCRFDVALVNAQKIARPISAPASNETPASTIQLGQPTLQPGYRLTLTTYLDSAFE